MKRKIFFAAASVLLSAMLVTAHAAEYVRQSEQEDAFLITGSGYGAFQNVPILVLNEDASGDEIASLIASGADISAMVAATGEAAADYEGNVSYLLRLGSEVKRGIYKVYVGGSMHEVGFIKNSERLALVDKLVSAGNKLASVLDESYQYLSIDTGLYRSCSGSSAIASVLAAELSGSGLSSSSENAFWRLSDMTDRAVLTVAANERRLTSFDQIVSKFASAENTKAVSGLTGSLTESGKSAALDSFQGCSFGSAPAADKRFAREVVLKSLCFPQVRTSTALINILNEYNSVLGLELSGFNKLSNSNKAEAIIKFSQQKPSVDRMQSVLDRIISEYNKTNVSVPSSGGGGGGGGGGGSSNSGGSIAVTYSAPSLPPASQAEESGEDAFNDLDETPWARDAILELHEKGIIDGYDDGAFAPQKSIKREEFVKLAVTAFYPDSSADETAFSDVPANAWYHDSIAVAYSKGMIGGMDDNTFGVGRNITRQDIAVILYRIAEDSLDVKNEEFRFDDDVMIADYARTAVYALREAGVINGVTDMEFAPQKDATRAETAVVLYRFINLINGGI